MASGKDVSLVLKRNGKKHDITISADSTVYELKKEVEKITNIHPDEQKLLGLVKSGSPDDEAVLGTLNIRDKTPFMVMLTADKFRKHRPSIKKPDPTPPEDKIALLTAEISSIHAKVEHLERELSAASGNAARTGNINYKNALDLQTELLTQALLKLDTIDSIDDRARRREQIKRVHEIQELIDAIRSKL